MNHLFTLFTHRFGGANSTPREWIRQYLEGELSAEAAEYVRRQLETSEVWRGELARMKNYLDTLHTLPKFPPPAQVWERIAAGLPAPLIQPSRRAAAWQKWLPRFDFPPAWGLAFRLVPILAVMAATTCWMETSFYEPQYEVVTVDAANGFGAEAEIYIAHHDLTGEPVFMKESLIAIYAHGLSK
ncbi:MAG TPA: hypothetical protein PKV38_05075 [bacterium]|nr:hypothetical protein [bacterium]